MLVWCWQLDPATFVRREGSQLTLGGRPFRFAGATNYYMLSRAVDKTTRPQVPASRIALRCMPAEQCQTSYNCVVDS